MSPAVSASQRRLMGWIHACQKGEGSNCEKVADVASSIKPSDAEKFAKTKHKGLPERKHKFKEYVLYRDSLIQEAMSYDQALDFVLTTLGLPSTKEKRNKDQLEMMMSMPVHGYPKGLDALMKEPTLRDLPNFQQEILPALTSPGTTVGRLVGIIADAKAQDQEAQIPRNDNLPEIEPDDSSKAPY